MKTYTPTSALTGNCTMATYYPSWQRSYCCYYYGCN